MIIFVVEIASLVQFVFQSLFAMTQLMTRHARALFPCNPHQ